MWISLLLPIGSLLAALSPSNAVIDIQSFKAEFNPALVKNISVALITVDDRHVINGSFVPQIDMPSFDITTIATAPRGRNRTTKYFDITLSGCQFVEQSFLNAISLSGFVFQNVRKSMKNLPEKCPIKKFKEISVSNLNMDSDDLAFLPPSRFDVTLKVMFKSKVAFRALISGAVNSNSKKIG